MTFKFVTPDDPGISSQLAGFATFRALDWAIQPRWEEGQASKTIPLITRQLMLVGRVAVPLTTLNMPLVGLKFQVRPPVKGGVMLLKLPDIREEMSLKEFAQYIKEYGIKNISLASEILSKKAVG